MRHTSQSSTLAATGMANVMTSLLSAVDAWFELAQRSAPSRFRDDDRMEVLGHLVRLLARRFHGFRELPTADDLWLEVLPESVTLRIRSPRHVPHGTDVLERQLAKFGFQAERSAGTADREVILRCGSLAGATIINFPAPRRGAPRRRKQRR